jgi:hypothetical protein
VNREEWLSKLAKKLIAEFALQNECCSADLVRISCGWPIGRKPGTLLGQCWAPEASAGGFIEIFISPLIGDPLTASIVLTHELIHATIGNHQGHGPVFGQVAKEIGFADRSGKKPGPELMQKLSDCINSIGETYPHLSLSIAEIEKTRPKQATRLKKVMCSACGYTIRVCQTWIDKGCPTCPCGSLMAVA